MFEVDNFSRQAIGFDRLFDVMNNIRGQIQTIHLMIL